MGNIIVRVIVRFLVRLYPWRFLIASIKEIGWDVSLSSKEKFIQGMVIGTRDYISGKDRL